MVFNITLSIVFHEHKNILKEFWIQGSCLLFQGEVVYVGKPDNEVIGYLCNCETFDKLPEDVLKSNVYVLKHDQSYILNHVDSTG